MFVGFKKKAHHGCSDPKGFLWSGWFFACVLCGVPSTLDAHPSQKPSCRGLALQPLGAFSTRSLWYTTLTSALRLHLRVPFTQLPARPLPKHTYYPRNRRYRADRLCAYLARLRPPSSCFILGLATVDISAKIGTHYDHAVFGLADHGGPAAILSTYRLEYVPALRKRRHILWPRLALHEIGHLLGLLHCLRRCVMRDAHRSIAQILALPSHFCRRCKRRLHRVWRRHLLQPTHLPAKRPVSYPSHHLN